MSKISQEEAGYMELANAPKDASCQKVAMTGGVSKQLGCCNEFKPKGEWVKQFRCGMCEYVTGYQAPKPIGAEK